MINGHTDQSIIRALIELGNSMKFRLVAEGIVPPEQRDFLRAMGIRLAQGYCYAHPMPASEVPRFIVRQHASAEPIRHAGQPGYP